MMPRIFLSLALLVSFTACTVEAPLEASVAQQIRIESVTVTVAQGRAFSGARPNSFGLAEERLIKDLKAALTRELRTYSKGGTRPVTARFEVTSIDLSSALPGLLRALPYSTITANVDIQDKRTGAYLLKGRSIMGNDNVGAHSLASATNATLSPGKDVWKAYADTVVGYAADARRQLLQWQGLQSAVN